MALDDLKLAQKWNPSDSKIKKRVSEFQNRYEKLYREKMVFANYMREKERLMQNQMSREEIQLNQLLFEEDSEARAEFYCFPYDGDDEATSYEINPNAKVPLEITELGEFLESKGNEIVSMYLKNGRKGEAEALRDKLKKAMVIFTTFPSFTLGYHPVFTKSQIAKKQLERISILDFSRPKTKLKVVAEKLG